MSGEFGNDFGPGADQLGVADYEGFIDRSSEKTKDEKPKEEQKPLSSGLRRIPVVSPREFIRITRFGGPGSNFSGKRIEDSVKRCITLIYNDPISDEDLVKDRRIIGAADEGMTFRGIIRYDMPPQESSLG